MNATQNDGFHKKIVYGTRVALDKAHCVSNLSNANVCKQNVRLLQS